MRKLIPLLSILLALPLVAAETWRWKDANGVVHYSDRPGPGAERVDIRATQPSGQVAPPPSQVVVTAPQPAAEAPKFLPYTRCVVTSPKEQENLVGPATVLATTEVVPGIQLDHQVRMLLNGLPYPEWPSREGAHTISELSRGTYTLQMRILDARGRQLCFGPAVTFFVRQPSVLSPARRATPRR
jgi:Domain of unknown function (DUF4124)